MISGWYARRMEAWENQLCFRSTNRIVRPFEWGVEWLERWPIAKANPRNGHSPEEYIRLINERSIAESASVFDYEKPTRFDFDGSSVRFDSPVETPYPENNRMHARYFPAAKKTRKCVIVLPHWNASPGQHVALCQGFQKLGLSSIRMSIPYHDVRMPAELERADYAMSSNIGRTLDATRQAVIDIRASIDWLETLGYEEFALVGTSIGSCYAFLTTTYDSRIKVNVFNHCSAYVADVVWTGLSTQHIRESFEGHLTLDGLHKVWDMLSPAHHMETFARRNPRSLFIYTKYDTTFLPKFAKQAVDHVAERGLDHRVVVLPCGHYTMGESPFKFIDGFHICSFVKRNL